MQFPQPTLGLSAISGRNIALTIGAAALITLSAKVQVPFWPVPMTLHTLAVLLISVMLGPRLGFAAMSAYLAAGLAGLPVFSGSPERGIGLVYMVGPTGGYLLGYLIASWLTGWLAQGRGLVPSAAAMLAGLAVVYAAGMAWLLNFVPAGKVVAAGFAPFILGDLVKIVLALTIVAAWRGMRRDSA
ncbi:biotin transporter BioY [Paracoccus albus]|uniref:biotin transporter BioY n=1 Tax=Paracoccus albus TaxID=3017784 RepID=UPI0022F0690F|nr:biotin transporter BioY [Paracoccus albus]WBU58991.1 biotin transporter BioY [Paracoccus albus]